LQTPWCYAEAYRGFGRVRRGERKKERKKKTSRKKKEKGKKNSW